MWRRGCFSLLKIKGFGEVHTFLRLGLPLEDLEGFLWRFRSGNVGVSQVFCKNQILRNLLLNSAGDCVLGSSPSLNSSSSDRLRFTPLFGLPRPNLMEARFRGCSFLPTEIHPANVLFELGFQGLFITQFSEMKIGNFAGRKLDIPTFESEAFLGALNDRPKPALSSHQNQLIISGPNNNGVK